MKKLLDVFILTLVAFFLIILFDCSVAKGQRRNRTLDNPQVIIPKARLVKNNLGGYNYWVKGKRVGHSVKNIHGSYDVYIKGRMKYKGVHFNNTNSTRYYSTYVNKVNHRTHKRHRNTHKSDLQRYGDRRAEYLKKWSEQRTASATGRVYLWDHFYPQN